MVPHKGKRSSFEAVHPKKLQSMGLELCVLVSSTLLGSNATAITQAGNLFLVA